MAKRIIPCLDIQGGRVVKGAKFKDLVDVNDPVQLARSYNQQGADELVMYDISASSEGRGIALQLVRDIAAEVTIPFIVGGGIRSLQDIQSVLEAGADKVSITSARYRTPLSLRKGPKSSEAAVSLLPLMPKRWEQAAGTSLSTAAVSIRAGTCSNGPGNLRASAQGNWS